MDLIWITIKNWLENHAPEISNDLIRGALKSEIKNTEKILGVKFPADMEESISICNGQNGLAAPLMGDWQILSLEMIIKKWKMLKTSLEGKNDEWEQTWIPIAHNGAGDYLLVILNDKSKFQFGQIIEHWHADIWNKGKIVADSYKEWLGKFASELESGKWKYLNDEMIKK